MKNGVVKMLARLSLKSESEGGRRTPIRNGFQTDIKFSDEQNRIVAIELEKDFLFPGEAGPALCNILLHSDAEIDHLLEIGTTVMSDGGTVIGTVAFNKVIDRESIVWENL